MSSFDVCGSGPAVSAMAALVGTETPPRRICARRLGRFASSLATALFKFGDAPPWLLIDEISSARVLG